MDVFVYFNKVIGEGFIVVFIQIIVFGTRYLAVGYQNVGFRCTF